MKNKLTTYSLILANIVPLIGVIFFGWDVFQLILLYWSETVIIGLYNILKIIKTAKWIGLFLVPFFIIHFGGFSAGHLFFILLLFNPEGTVRSSTIPNAEILLPIVIPLIIPIIGFFISHGISFINNFIKNKEYKKLANTDLMSAPYKRIVIMHITIVFGGFLTLLFSQQLAFLILFVILKTILDVKSHKKEHSL